MNSDNAIREEEQREEKFYFFHPLKRAKRLAKKHTITGQKMRTVVVRFLIILFEVVLLSSDLAACLATAYNGKMLISSVIRLRFSNWDEWGKVIVLYLAVTYLIVLVRNIFLKKGKYQRNVILLFITNIISVLTICFYIVSNRYDVRFGTYLCVAISLIIFSMFMHGAVYEIQNGEDLPLKEWFVKWKKKINEKMKNRTEAEKEAHRKKFMILRSVIALFIVIAIIAAVVKKSNDELAKGTYQSMVMFFNATDMTGIWDISGVDGNLVIYGEGQANPYFQCGIEGNMIQGQLITGEAQIFSATPGQFTMSAKEMVEGQHGYIGPKFRVDISCTLPNGENRTYTDVVITELDSGQIYLGICDGVINQVQVDKYVETGRRLIPILNIDYNGERKSSIDPSGKMLDEILRSNNGQVLGDASLNLTYSNGALSMEGIILNYAVIPALEFKSSNTYFE